MGKKERLSEFHRANILAAAKILFREKGAAQTTVDDIAKKSEYSKSTIYVYFKSKEAIYNSIVLEFFQMLKEAIIDALRESPGFPDAYFAICDAMVRLCEENPQYFEVILSSIDLPEGEPKDEAEGVLLQIYNIGEEINEIICEYIRKCAAQGVASINADPFQVSFTLWASISGVIMLANKKELYIRRKMGISKAQFMRDGFTLLLKSVMKEA